METITLAGGSSSDNRVATTLRPFVSLAATTSGGKASSTDAIAVRVMLTSILSVSSPRAICQRRATASRYIYAAKVSVDSPTSRYGKALGDLSTH